MFAFNPLSGLGSEAPVKEEMSRKGRCPSTAVSLDLGDVRKQNSTK